MSAHINALTYAAAEAAYVLSAAAHVLQPHVLREEVKGEG